MNKLPLVLLAWTTVAIVGVGLAAAAAGAAPPRKRDLARELPISHEGVGYRVEIYDTGEDVEDRFEWHVFKDFPGGMRRVQGPRRTSDLELAEAEARDWIAANA